MIICFYDNTFAPPPHDLDYIGDINTSKAYMESYRKYITEPIQTGAVAGYFLHTSKKQVLP
jgi:hypothetical protein